MSKIKECIVPRHLGWKYVSIDYKQLEIVGKALVTNDPVMKQDIRDGKSFHSLRGSMLAGISYEEFYDKAEVQKLPKYVAIRKDAKSVSFGKEFGQHPKNIAKKLGWSVKRVEEFIEQEDSRYHVAKKYFDDLEERVYNDSVPTDLIDKNGNQIYKSVQEGLFGKTYTYTSVWNRWKNTPQYEKSKILNYEVQGFSTGDLTQVANACILNTLFERDLLYKVIPVLYTYDSNDFEIDNGGLDYYIDIIASAMTTGVKKAFLEDFDFDIDIPLAVDVVCGNNKDLNDRDNYYAKYST